MTNIRQLVGNIAGSPAINGLASRLLPPWATIFMLHRIAIPELGVPGLDPDYLRRCLQYLRKQRFELISLDEVVLRCLDNSLQNKNYVVFTLDDGCFEQADLAARLFQEFDCPATTFLITGYLDGTLWPWDYKLIYLSDQIPPPNLNLDVGDKTISLTGKPDWAKQLIGIIRRHAPQQADLIVENLFAKIGMEIPAAAPPELAATSWNQVRAAEKQGMRFGAHSVSHHNLFGPSAERIETEIVESIDRVASECKNPSRVFCYPSGKVGDFDDVAINTVQRKNMLAAVSAEAGFVKPALVAGSSYYRFVLPRMTIAESFDDFSLSLTWAQYLRENLSKSALASLYD